MRHILWICGLLVIVLVSFTIAFAQGDYKLVGGSFFNATTMSGGSYTLTSAPTTIRSLGGQYMLDGGIGNIGSDPAIPPKPTATSPQPTATPPTGNLNKRIYLPLVSR